MHVLQLWQPSWKYCNEIYYHAVATGRSDLILILGGASFESKTNLN